MTSPLYHYAFDAVELLMGLLDWFLVSKTLVLREVFPLRRGLTSPGLQLDKLAI